MPKKAFINPSLCDGMPTCAVKFVCPVGAVTQKRGLFGGAASVNREKCIGCGKCAAVCPRHAVIVA